MKQIDWVGDEKPRKVFKDIHNTRNAVAEQKARLVLELNGFLNAIPPKIKSGGTVGDVREWRVAHEAAKKIASSSRSSVHELTAAISNMQRYFR